MIVPCKIVHPVAERHLRQRQPHRHPVRRDVREIIQVNAANGEISQFVETRRVRQLAQLARHALRARTRTG